MQNKEEKKSRGCSLWLLLILLVICAIALWFFFGGDGFGFGKSAGKDDSNSQQETQEEIMTEEEKSEITIRIEDKNIYIDDEQCIDVNDLKDKVTKLQSSGNTKKYVLDDKNAIKSTTDEVKQALQDLKDGIGIEF